NRVPDEAQAITVRRIFDLCRQGFGDLRIVNVLTEEKHPVPFIPQPKVGPRRKAKWSKPMVKHILRNPIYIGVLEYGKKRSVKRAGSVGKSVKVDPSAWTRTEVPHLRIIDQAVWDEVRAIKEGRAKKQPTATHRGRGEVTSSFTLNGFVKCGVCHGALAFAG